MSIDSPKCGVTRRRFLVTSGAAALGSFAAVASAKTSEVKIDRIDVFPMRYPTVGYFKFFEGPAGHYGRAAVILKITADNGVVGWGQSVPVARWCYETLDTATIVLRDYLAPTLVGRDPRDIIGAHKAMDKAVAPALTTGMPLARAGLDLALHDLVGKLKGQSLAQMWGRPRGGPVRLSWTVNARSLDEADKVIDAGSKRGYRNFNIKIAPDPKFDLRLAKHVRRRAPEGFLWADANGGYDPATALEIAPKLADAGVDALEAPIRPNRLSGYQALKKQGALPIFMDEGVISPVELGEFVRLRMFDGVTIKVSRCGGLVSARRQIEILRDAGLMWLGSGLTDPDISLAASLGLFGAYGLKRPAALNGAQFLTADVLSKPLKPTGDSIEVPPGAGLGVEVDEAKVVELMRRAEARGHDHR